MRNVNSMQFAFVTQKMLRKRNGKNKHIIDNKPLQLRKSNCI